MAAGEASSTPPVVILPRLPNSEKFPPLNTSKAAISKGSHLTFSQALQNRKLLVQDGISNSPDPVIVNDKAPQVNNIHHNNRSFLEAALGMNGTRETDTSFASQQLDFEALNPISTYLGKPAVLFSTPEKLSLLANLNLVLIGKFSHGRPSLVDLKLFFAGLKLVGRYNISIFDNKHVYIEIELKVDYTRLWLKLVWIVKGFAMRIFKWDSDFSPATESALAPVWIRLEGLPLYLFDVKSLCSIANAIGKPLRVDTLNVNRIRLNSARVCVELNVAKPLSDAIWVGFGEGDTMEGFWVKVFYDVLPPFCSFCKHMGHPLDHCLRQKVEPAVIVPKPVSSQVWTVKQKPYVDLDLKSKGKEIAPMVHTVEAGTSLGCCSSTITDDAATGLRSDTEGISIGGRNCTAGQNIEEVTKENVEGQIPELHMEKNQQDLKSSMNSTIGEAKTEWTTVIRKKNKGSKGIQSKSNSCKNLEVQGFKIAIVVSNVEEQTLTTQQRVATNQELPGTDAMVTDQTPIQEKTVKEGLLGQYQSNSAQDDKVRAEGLEDCSTRALVVWKGAIAEEQPTSPASNDSEDQPAEYNTSPGDAIKPKEQQKASGKDDVAALHSELRSSAIILATENVIAVRSEVSNNDKEAINYQMADGVDGSASEKMASRGTNTEHLQQHIRPTLRQKALTLTSTSPNIEQEVNTATEHTSSQEGQVVCQKNFKAVGVVTRSQTKIANYTWAEKVENEQVEQSPIATKVQAGNNASQDYKSPTKSRYQLQMKIDKLFSRLSNINMRDGIRRQLRAELAALRAEKAALEEEHSLLS